MRLFQRPLHVLLLPCFFVLHAFTEYWQFIDLFDIVLLTVKYLLLAIAIFGLAWIIFRKRYKAGILVFIVLSINFFFPDTHTFIKKNIAVPFFGRYIFLLPLLMVILAAVLVRLGKTQHTFVKFNSYVNITLILLLIFDTGTLIWRFNNAASYNRVSLKNPVTGFQPCQSCPEPDIYLFVFDEYASSLALKDSFGYDNTGFDSFLVAKGFHIQYNSMSNYNWTQFAMASVLNMSYLDIPEPKALGFADYLSATRLIRNSRFTMFLKQQGYSIENYTIFNLDGKKAPLENNFLPESASLISDKTFTSTILRDLGWHVITIGPNMKILRRLYDERFINIHKGIELAKNASAVNSSQPRFIYGHFLLPHAPFYMRQMEKETDIARLVKNASESSVSGYLNYLPYTNKVAMDLITTVLKNSDGKAVIMFMGDHGARLENSPPSKIYFQNQNAIYLPDKNYSMFYDSVTGVNQCRILLNQLFSQQIPLLKDSSYMLFDKK